MRPKSSDINVYNDFVQSVADSSPDLAALGIEWRALASTTTVEAIDNTMTHFTDENPGLPFFRVDGGRFVSDYETLLDSLDLGIGLLSIAVDEFGTPIEEIDGFMGSRPQVRVWTGMFSQDRGKLGSASRCLR